MAQYKILVEHDNRIDYFCVNHGKKSYPAKGDHRNPLLFGTADEAQSYADSLKNKFPDTIYEVIPHVFRDGF